MMPDKKEFYEKTSRYIELMVPRTWLYATISFLFGYLISEQSDAVLLILGLVLFGPVLTGATNLINMYYDKIEDEINKPIRKDHLKVLGEKNVRNATFLLYMVALLLSLYFGSLLFTFMILLYIIISFTYSSPPLRFKKRFMINLFMLAYGSVFLPFISAWTINSVKLYEVPWGIATIATTSVMFPIASKDITDPLGDKKAGNSTLFTILSFYEDVKLFVFMFLWIPYVVVILLVWIGLAPKYMLALLAFSVITYLDMKNGLKLKKFDPNKSKEYFKTVFWHIILLLTLSLSIPIVFIYLY